MTVELFSGTLAESDADAVVIGIFEEAELVGYAKEIDQITGGTINRLVERKELSGKPGKCSSILAPSGLQTSRLVVVGLGKQDAFDVGRAFSAAATAAKHLATSERGSIVYALHNSNWTDDQVEAAVCGSLVGCVGQDLHRAEKKLHPPEKCQWYGVDAAQLTSGGKLSTAVNFTRELVNGPPNYVYPESFITLIQQAFADTPCELEVWDEERLQAEKCGSMLGVAQGSTKKPRLGIIRYNGNSKDATIDLALVGKGVTFDSGGLSLKPSEGMKTMKCDMAGAATAVGAIHAIAQLGLPINVVSLVGLVENMPSANAFRLGDVLTARSGKTIEVLNTDAEGRLVLADVLNVTVEMAPRRIIDMATLTGACVVALGLDTAGLMTNNETLCDDVKQAAEFAGERVWELPMFPEFAEQIKSEVADIKNIGQGRWGGAITAAKFLEEFVDDVPWVHIDLAGPAFLDSAKPALDAGGSGAIVRTLVQLARQYCSS